MLVCLVILNLIKFFDYVHGILGGSKIEIQQAPYHVSYGDVCGGVLINRKWVITTAHCGKEDFVRVGHKHRLEGTKIKIQRNIVHPEFGKKHEFDYDIQLLELARKLKISDRVMPIAIIDGVYGKDIYRYIDSIYVAGWGYPKERGNYLSNLEQVKLKLVPMKTCQKVDQKWYNNTLTTRMFCAGGDKKHDACQGDSGGAAMWNGWLLGIASFGYGCGRNIPGVYINVTNTNIRNFIFNYTGVSPFTVVV